MVSRDPQYFTRLSLGQAPSCLWIGCIDSRVAPELITNSSLGKMIVYRSPANTFYPENDEVRAVLDLAIHVIGVRSIVVCGHSLCGALCHFLDHVELAQSNGFFARIQALAQKCEPELSASSDKACTLARLNVIDQVRRIEKEKYVTQAQNGPVSVHGLFYEISTGHLQMLGKEGEWHSSTQSTGEPDGR